MKVKVLKPFKDYKENVKREVGDVFECTKTRFNEIEKKLLEYGEGPWVEEIKEKKPTKKK